MNIYYKRQTFVLGNNQSLMSESHETQICCMSKICGFIILQQVVTTC